jgi:urease accessory protein
MGRLAVEEIRVQELYVYTCLRDLVSAAIRLGLLGPQDGHAMLARACLSRDVLGTVPPLAAAARLAPVLEIVQARHAGLYTKLFQS